MHLATRHLLTSGTLGWTHQLTCRPSRRTLHSCALSCDGGPQRQAAQQRQTSFFVGDPWLSIALILCHKSSHWFVLDLPIIFLSMVASGQLHLPLFLSPVCSYIMFGLWRRVLHHVQTTTIERTVSNTADLAPDQSTERGRFDISDIMLTRTSRPVSGA
jgi:hypothetical protein